MQDPVREEEILLEDTGRVDEDGIGREGELQFRSLESFEDGAIGEVAAVADEIASADDVVGEDFCEVVG